MEELDTGSQLRRQLAQVVKEKEAAKVDLESLRRTIDRHLLTLNSILGSPDVASDRLTTAIKAFDMDLKGRLDTSDSGGRGGVPAEGTYAVLRQSLSDAQKRCQDLNADMLRLADGNEELMGTLKTLKGTNKRLVEEVQKQTEELSYLTQQRLLDMDNLTRLDDAFRHEKAMWQEEAKRTIDEEQRACNEEFERMRDNHSRRLEECLRLAKSVASKTGTIRIVQSQLKGELKNFAQVVSAEMKRVERDMQTRIVDTLKSMNAEQLSMKDAEHNLLVKLRAEREVRENETEAWKARYNMLAAELDEVVAKRDKELGDVNAAMEGLHAIGEQEAAVASKERQALQDDVESHAKETALLEAMIQTSRRKTLQLESRLAQAEGERDRLAAAAETLRQQIRESDEALEEAVRSNEALREQMEVQRLDAQAANERDLKLCREMFEKKISAHRQNGMHEQADIAKRIRGCEEQIGMKAGEVQAMRELVEQRVRQRDGLQRDLLVWKAQYELANKAKGEVEKDLTQFRQDVLGKELLSRQEHHDELASRKADLEVRRAQLLEELHHTQQIVKERELADTQALQALTDMHREATAELNQIKQTHSQVEDELAVAKSEHAATTQQMSERRDALEQELARLTSDLEVEKRDFERKIKAERQNAEGLRGNVEKLRLEHNTSYRSVVEGPVQQIALLEGAISDIHRNSEAELNTLRNKYEKNRLRIEELETELTRAHAKLEQAETEVQDTTSRVSAAKSNARSAREVLERERVMKQEELQQVQRSIAQKMDQLRNMERSGEDMRRRMLRDVEELKASKSKQLTDIAPRSTFPTIALEDNKTTGYPGSVVGSPNPRLSSPPTALYSSSVAPTSPLTVAYGGTFAPPYVSALSVAARPLSSMEERAATLRRELQGTR